MNVKSMIFLFKINSIENFMKFSNKSIVSFNSIKHASISKIQNSAKCLSDDSFTFLKTGPKLYTSQKLEEYADKCNCPEFDKKVGDSNNSFLKILSYIKS